MSTDARDVLRIVDAYGVVLSRAAHAVTYLLYLSGSILSGWLAGAIIPILLGVSPVTWTLSIAAFAVVFMLAAKSSSLIFRISSTHRLLSIQAEKRMGQILAEKRVGKWIWLGWLASFAAGFPLSFLLVPAGLSVIVVPVAVSLGLAFGNVGIFLSELLIAGERDARPLFVSLYILLTLPTYYIWVPFVPVPSQVVMAYAALTVHSSISNFGAAVWYLLSSGRAASGILHAARREH